LENPELVKLPSDFYMGIAEYVGRLKEESRMLDKRTIKASLLRKEMQNVKRMVQELIRSRYAKIVNKAANGKDIPREALTVEEEQACARISLSAETMSNFATEILHGQLPVSNVEVKRKRVSMRILKDVPAIIGADMKTYGPFKTEDVASFPLENAKILLKQGLAEKIAVN